MTSERIRPLVGKRLSSLRVTRGQTSDEFAAEIGERGGTYRRWERGEVQPSVHALYNIQMLTGCSLNWLVCGIGSVNAPE